jgi:hypothetical protein
MKTELIVEPKQNALYVPCPVCGAFPGSVCRTKRGVAIFPAHATRITKYLKWKLKKEQA